MLLDVRTIKIGLGILTSTLLMFSAWFYVHQKNITVRNLESDKNRLEVSLANANLNVAKFEYALDVQNSAVLNLKHSKERADKEFSASLKDIEQDKKALLALVNAKPQVVTQYVTQDCNKTQVNEANEALSLLLDGVK